MNAIVYLATGGIEPRALESKSAALATTPPDTYTKKLILWQLKQQADVWEVEILEILLNVIN